MRKEIVADTWSHIRSALVAHARRRVGSLTDAQDCVQETARITLETLGTYREGRGEGGIGAWLFGILANVCREYRRARERLREQSLDTDSQEWEALEQGVYSELARAELRHEARFRLRHANLTPMERTCFAAHLNGERTVQTARRLGLSVRAVQRYAQSAVGRLRTCPVAELHAPVTRDYLFRLCSAVTVYTPPLPMGLQLDRQKLRRMR